MYSLEQFVAYEKQQAITDADIRQLVTRPIKIRNYYGLTDKDSLETLCPKVGDGCVLFWKAQNKAIGHFNCILRHTDKEYEWFDSYGLSPQQVSNKVTHDGAKLLMPMLRGKNVFYGKHAFQRGEDTNTCGRYVAFRFNCHAFRYNEFKHLLSYRGVSPDDLITLLTIQVDFSHINDRRGGR